MVIIEALAFTLVVVGGSLIAKAPGKDGNARMSTRASLYALLAAIKRSPILPRVTERLLLARSWASVRKSPDVDAYVLAWIASHVRGPRTRWLAASTPAAHAPQVAKQPPRRKGG